MNTSKMITHLHNIHNYRLVECSQVHDHIPDCFKLPDTGFLTVTDAELKLEHLHEAMPTTNLVEWRRSTVRGTQARRIRALACPDDAESSTSAGPLPVAEPSISASSTNADSPVILPVAESSTSEEEETRRCMVVFAKQNSTVPAEDKVINYLIRENITIEECEGLTASNILEHGKVALSGVRATSGTEDENSEDEWEEPYTAASWAEDIGEVTKTAAIGMDRIFAPSAQTDTLDDQVQALLEKQGNFKFKEIGERSVALEANEDCLARLHKREALIGDSQHVDALYSFVLSTKFAFEWAELPSKTRFRHDAFERLAPSMTFEALQHRHEKIIRARNEVKKLFLEVRTEFSLSALLDAPSVVRQWQNRP
ncbi:hypothetical protein CPB84DRAFT_1842050 [Gymnopilus junonius]|uniref:Uncharacterized protein n=1 Tax=Gymnopilus junonius TaxID=109634 RepID=A0A9P5P1H1_GYMJU|nr:hypothetical protein CPB84DRAFT_1842050 [Gymnopilus junonius]